MWQAIADMVASGAVREWAAYAAEKRAARRRAGARPGVTIPVFCIGRPSSAPANRLLRFVYDCRWLNRLPRRRPFKLERPQGFAMSRGYLPIAIDFSSAYWHVPASKRSGACSGSASCPLAHPWARTFLVALPPSRRGTSGSRAWSGV